MNLFYHFLIGIFIFSVASLSLYSAEVKFQDMTPYTTKVYGDVKVIGNTSLELNTSYSRTDNQWFRSDDDASWGRNVTGGLLQDIWIGAVADVSGYEANNFAFMKYMDVDADGATFNSSSSTLTLNAGSEILYVRLYWSGMIHNFSDGSSINTQKTNSHQVKIKVGNSSYQDVVVGTTDGYNTTEGWTDLGAVSGNLEYSRYSAYKDITSIFSGLVFDGNTTNITVADVVSTEGWMRNYGNYGAWSLAVVYRNSNESFKHIALYTGYEVVYNTATPLEIPITGFLTPKASSVVSTLSVFAIEGEKTTAFGEDYLKVEDIDGNFLDVTNNTSYPNAKTNIFDSTISNNETKDKNITNTMGIDIDTFSIGADGDLSHPQIIQNLQNSTTIQLSSNGDAYTVNALALSTELYIPTFCFDYAYKQDNRYFTEANDGSQDPYITGSVITTSPIEVTIFIRNLVDSDIDVTDMFVNIEDINTSQAPYIDSSIKLTKVGDLTPQSVSATTTPSYIHDVEIGSMTSKDYFYVDYQLDPQVTTLAMPINFVAEYNLTIGSTVIPYTLTLGAEIPMCDSTNFNYLPTSGIFNVIHKNYYNSTTQYYNLPTQVINRIGSFQALALDPVDYNTLKGQSTIIAVEAIDAGAFHNTDASCFEQYNYITNRKWILFENNASQVDLSLASDYFQEVRENVAFRIAYNLTTDGNNDLVNVETVGVDSYKINYTELVQTIGTCSQSVELPAGGTTTDVAIACGNNANISKAQLEACMECIYGYNTKYVCSRDNFSIRPESFMIKLNDQNQTNTAVTQRIADDISGVVSPSLASVDLSAGYKYNIEIKATNHVDNTQAVGYTKSYALSPNDIAEYTWEPRATVVTGCNDIEDKLLDIRFTNGTVDTNTSVYQVGEYRLNILDQTWTQVDSNPLYMSHHDGNIYFLDSTNKDCIVDSTIVNSVGTSNATPLVGCNTSSSHINIDNNLVYQDYNLTFYPYKFDISSISPTVGVNHDTMSATSYVYMTDLSQDQNMSFHLNGNIIAHGYYGNFMSNFVTSCFAKPLDLNITKTNTNGTVSYQYRLNSGTVVDFNNSITPIVLQDGNFTKDLNGTAQTVLNFNFERDITSSQNPELITFTDYHVDCSQPADCTFNADLIPDKTTKGEKTLNSAATRYYYGRTHAPRAKFIDNATVVNHDAFIYYEVFCNGAGCDKTLLQDSTDSNVSDDPRWFINTQHTSFYGAASNVTEKRASGTVITATPPTGNHQDKVTVKYSGNKGYPYVTTMQNDAPSWLIYNKFNVNADKNEFSLEFNKNAGGYVGSGKSTKDINVQHSDSSSSNENKSWW